MGFLGRWSLVTGHWLLVKRLRLRKGEKEKRRQEIGDRRQSGRLKLFVLNIITALRTSPAGTERTPVRCSLAIAFFGFFSAKEKRTEKLVSPRRLEK